MCKIGEDYRLADYYYIKSFCFGSMTGTRKKLYVSFALPPMRSLYTIFRYKSYFSNTVTIYGKFRV